jgi:predicted component of type VI protein secretion system
MALAGPHSATAAELKDRLDLERLGGPFLILRDGAESQVLVPLAGDRAVLTLGRSEECDVALRWDTRVSRVHAQLERVGDGWAIADGGLSRNGSFLNGERLHARRRLSDGDVLRLGATELLYRQPRGAGMRVITETVTASDATAVPSVSPAQFAVLRALCRPLVDATGFAVPASNKDIAAELFLSLDAVKGHLRALFARFGLDGLAQNEKRLRLAERALGSGLVTPAELRRDEVRRDHT